jgi:tRNA(His) guanylyltransferase
MNLLGQGTLASEKHEILFANFKINYNNEAEMFKKGSLLYRQQEPRGKARGDPTDVNQVPLNNDDHNAYTGPESTSQKPKPGKAARCIKIGVTVDHVDLIKEKFWLGKPWLLSKAET